MRDPWVIPAKKRILVVEDETHLAEGLKLNLSLKGYDVMIAADGISGPSKMEGVAAGPDRAGHHASGD